MAAMIQASLCGFLEVTHTFYTAALPQPPITITEDDIAACRSATEDGFGSTHVPKVITRRQAHRAATAPDEAEEKWSPPLGARLARTAVEEVQPSEDVVQAAAAVAPSTAGDLANAGADLKQRYIDLRTQLLGNTPPERYGLGGEKPESLGLGFTSNPKAVTALAVGFYLKWGGKSVVLSLDEQRVSLFCKPTVSYPSGLKHGAQT